MISYFFSSIILIFIEKHIQMIMLWFLLLLQGSVLNRGFFKFVEYDEQVQTTLQQNNLSFKMFFWLPFNKYCTSYNFKIVEAHIVIFQPHHSPVQDPFSVTHCIITIVMSSGVCHSGPEAKIHTMETKTSQVRFQPGTFWSMSINLTFLKHLQF